VSWGGIDYIELRIKHLNLVYSGFLMVGFELSCLYHIMDCSYQFCFILQ